MRQQLGKGVEVRPHGAALSPRDEGVREPPEDSTESRVCIDPVAEAVPPFSGCSESVTVKCSFPSTARLMLRVGGSNSVT